MNYTPNFNSINISKTLIVAFSLLLLTGLGAADTYVADNGNFTSAVDKLSNGDTLLLNDTIGLDRSVEFDEKNLEITSVASEKATVERITDKGGARLGTFELMAEGIEIHNVEFYTPNTQIEMVVGADDVTVRNVAVERPNSHGNPALYTLDENGDNRETSGLVVFNNDFNGASVGISPDQEVNVSQNDISNVGAEGIWFYSAVDGNEDIVLKGNEISDYGTTAIKFQERAPNSVNSVSGEHKIAAEVSSSNDADTVKIAETVYPGPVENADTGVTYHSIQTAINKANGGDTVEISPGTYKTEGRYSQNYDIGLHLNQTGISLVGVDSDGDRIQDSENTEAELISQASTGFGTNGFYVSADGVTISGLELTPNPSASPNKNLEISGDDFTLKNSKVNGKIGSVYFNTGEVQAFKISNNELNGSLSVNNGVGNATDASNRVVEENEIGLLSFAGAEDGVAWRNFAVGPVTVEDNVIEGHRYELHYTDNSGDEQVYVYSGVVSSVGNFTEYMDWSELIEKNEFMRGAYVLNESSDTSLVDPEGDAPYYRIHYAVQETVDEAAEGQTVEVLSGDYNENLDINESITLRGSGTGETVIAPENGRVIDIVGNTNDDSTVSDVTIERMTLEAGDASIALQANSATNDGYNTINLTYRDLIVDQKG
jgi:hypothetical protein